MLLLKIKKYYCLAFLLLTFCCSTPSNKIDFEFTAHNLKVKLDPSLGQLAAIDTISIKYNRNVDHFYFFLHDSLHVERVGIGHQQFALQPIKPGMLNRDFPNLNNQFKSIVEKSQIVQVQIPKSLYPEKIEIWYSGLYDEDVLKTIAWYPTLPDALTTFRLTTLTPKLYEIKSDGILSQQEQDDDWKICVWEKDKPSEFIALFVGDDV